MTADTPATPDTIQSVLADLERSASSLGDTTVLARAHAVAGLAQNPKLRILIAGSAGSGRSLVANFLLGKPDLLPSSPLPKRPIPLTLSYSESPALTATLADGLRVAEPAERLRGLLIGADSDADELGRIEIGTEAALLKTADLRIETIGEGRSDAQWEELLAETGFTLVVLRASALLSAAEAAFIGNSLVPALNSGRAAVLINQIDLISTEERPALGERIRAFFRSFEIEPLIIELSAAEAVRALRAGSPSAGDGAEQLTQLVHEDLLSRGARLKSAAVRSEAAACLDALRTAAMRRRSLSLLSESEMQVLIDKLDARGAWLQSRLERAEQRVDLYVSTLARERLLGEIEGFSRAFKDQLPHELEQIRDLALLRRYLPGYLDTIWDEFFAARLPDLRAALADELEQIARQVAADLRELAEEQGIDANALAAGFEAAPGMIRSFWQPRRSESGAAAVATNMQFAGLLLLLLPGLQLIGAASVGIGQVVRMASRRAEHDAQRKAILAAVIEAWPSLERQIARQIEGRFAALAAELRGTVRTMYDRAIEVPRAALAGSAAQHAALNAERAGLERLLDETIPALAARLRALGPAGETE